MLDDLLEEGDFIPYNRKKENVFIWTFWQDGIWVLLLISEIEISTSDVYVTLHFIILQR